MGLILLHGLARRDVTQDLMQLPQTLTSFDKCMSKNYCKYPFIAGCVIGGIIIISLLWCLIRCCMCGVACCSCCCGGCGGRKTKHTHSTVEVHHQHPMGVTGPYGDEGFNRPGYQPTKPPAYEPPQYAIYEVNRNGGGNADALPHMPTWETTKIEAQEEMELKHVNNDGHRRAAQDEAKTGRAGDFPTLGAYPADHGGMPRSQSPGNVHMHAPQPIVPITNVGFNARGPSPGPGGPIPYPQEDPHHHPSSYGTELPVARTGAEAWNQPDSRADVWSHPQQSYPPTLTHEPSSVNPYQYQNQSGNRQSYDYPNFDNQPTQPQQSHYRAYNPRINEFDFGLGPGHDHSGPAYGQNLNDHDDPRRDPKPDQQRQKEWTVL